MQTVKLSNVDFASDFPNDCIGNNNTFINVNRSAGTRAIIENSSQYLEAPVVETPTSSNSIIYRFKFTQEFMDKLYIFSKIHQYDERKDFKEAWELWVEENRDDINSETRRVINLGYDGDVMDKMFKSARYYFRKKTEEKKVAKERRKYISVSHELLEAMDAHILSNMIKDDYQPKNGFILFCHENQELLKETINNILQQGFNDSALIQEKIKKTYKNRYFIVSKK